MMKVKKSLIYEVIVAAFIFLFAYTGLDKVVNLKQFEDTFSKLPFADLLEVRMYSLVPIIELSIVILLVIPRLRQIGLYCTFFLMLFFALFVLYMVLFVPKVPCSCGGLIKTMSWKQHIILNVLFTFLAAIGIKIKNRQRGFFNFKIYSEDRIESKEM